jgi:hypothetical protein
MDEIDKYTFLFVDVTSAMDLLNVLKRPTFMKSFVLSKLILIHGKVRRFLGALGRNED